MTSISSAIPNPSRFGKFGGANYSEFLQASVLPRDESRKLSRMRFVAPDLFCSPRGVLQGGFAAVFLDDVIGLAVLEESDGAKLPLTLDLNISYLKPIPHGPLIAEGRVVRLGRSVGFVEAELKLEDGTLLARATSTLMMQDMATFTGKPDAA